MSAPELPEFVPGWTPDDAARLAEIEQLGTQATLLQMQEYLVLGARRRDAQFTWARAELDKRLDYLAGSPRPGA